MPSRLMRTLATAGLATAALAAPAAAADERPTLLGRAIYPATQYQPGPISGQFISGDLNGVSLPFAGQPIPGFSAVLDLGGGRFLAMPDNGYGAKGNSSDYLLRAYVVAPDFRIAGGGSGAVDVIDTLQLRDPDAKVPFALTRADRLLTGADFDLESVRRTKDGTLWFGEEFGPFLLHTDSTGKVLEAPIALPGIQSPQNPYLAGAATQPASGGFEGMALSPDGRTLYPALEKATVDDATHGHPDRRIIKEFDIAGRSYTGRTWQYRTDAAFPNALIGDMTAIDEHRLLVIERDDGQGADARQKKLYKVDLRRTDADGYLVKTLVADLLDIADPSGISTPARPGEFGVGSTFSFPLQSVESVEILDGQRVLVANDNNFPFSDGRWTARDRPDDIEMIVLRTPGLR